MEARAELVVRRARIVALVALVLCAVGLGAPAAASAGTVHPTHHAVKVVNPAPSDQHGASQRLDQPQLASAAPRTSPGDPIAFDTASASPIASVATVDSPRTRGPPPDAR
jgi:hypothetical protein